MPLTLNVGLSRKASRNYQSTGVSINVTAELDQALLRRPKQLQQQIAKLYEQADDALQRQVQKQTPGAASPSANGDHAGRRHAHANGAATEPKRMTPAQRRVIESIAGQLEIDAAAEAFDAFGWTLDGLAAPQASQLIDHLRRLHRSVRR